MAAVWLESLNARPETAEAHDLLEVCGEGGGRGGMLVMGTHGPFCGVVGDCEGVLRPCDLLSSDRCDEWRGSCRSPRGHIVTTAAQAGSEESRPEAATDDTAESAARSRRWCPLCEGPAAAAHASAVAPPSLTGARLALAAAPATHNV